MGELLAPVGNLEMLQAAIDAGADAVFMAGPNYGARAKEANFSIESLKQAIDLAHLYGVRVYVTLNTLIKEAEWSDCKKYIDQLVDLAIDALIVQDIGVVHYCRHRHPQLPLHASTQMAISDEVGLVGAKMLGISRVVIARETSLKNVQRWSSAGMPMEVFVHGALCYAYSGQCLLSGIQGGRSGNRGQCAQPCRLTYRIDGEDKPLYAMSMKDLSTLDHVATLAKCGVASFKIEGRLRSPDYVYHTVRAYRMALDGLAGEALEPYKARMYEAFNREYTGGHLLEDRDRLNLKMSSNKGEMVGKTLKSSQYRLHLSLSADIYKGDGLKVVYGDQSKGIEVFNIYSNDGVASEARAGDLVAIDFNGLVPVGSTVYRTRSKKLTDLRIEGQGKRRVAVVGHFSAALGQPAVLTISDGVNEVTITSADAISEAKTAAATEAQVVSSLEKLGDTVYAWQSLHVTLGDGLFMAKAMLNGLRRDAIHALSEARLSQYGHSGTPAKTGDVIANKACSGVKQIPNWHIYVYQYDQIRACFDSANAASLPTDELRIFMSKALLCRALTDEDFSGAEKLSLVEAISPFERLECASLENDTSPIGISHFSQAIVAKRCAMTLGIASTVMNLEALRAWQSIGVDDVLASVELAPKEMTSLTEKGARAMVYGQLPAMYTRTCPKKAKGMSCRECSGAFTVEAKEGQKLQVHCDGDLLVYWTRLPIYRDGDWPYKMATFVDESAKQTKRIFAALINGEPLEIDALEAYQRPVN